MCSTEKEKPGSVFRSKRWRLCFLLFLAYTVTLLHRVNMSMAVVCFVRPPSDISTSLEGHSSNNVNNTDGQNIAEVENITASYLKNDASPDNTSVDIYQADLEKDDVFKVDWDKTQTSVLLSSYFYGCMVTQIPGGRIADAAGGRNIILASFVVTAASSLLIPICVKTLMYGLVFALRVVIGLASGFVVPAGISMLGTWAPPRERAAMISLSGCGFSFGPALSYFTSGYLCAYGFDGGWPSVFYVHGIVAALFSVLWWFQAYSSPSDHPTISRKELSYILAARTNTSTVKNVKTPWMSILTSRPMWASIVAHFCFNWGFYSVLINVPMFMKEVLHFDITQNAFFSALPYMTFFLGNIFWAKISFILYSKQCLSALSIRRLWTTIGLVGASLTLILAVHVTVTLRHYAVVLLCCTCSLSAMNFSGFLANHATCLVGASVTLILAGHVTVALRHYAVVLLCCTCSLSATNFSGFLANHAEYAGVHSGTAYGISNSLSVISAILSAVMAGVMTPNGSQREWQHVFYLSAGVNVLGAIFFFVCASATLQKWAELKDEAGNSTANHKLEIEVLTNSQEDGIR